MTLGGDIFQRSKMYTKQGTLMGQGAVTLLSPTYPSHATPLAWPLDSPSRRWLYS